MDISHHGPLHEEIEYYEEEELVDEIDSDEYSEYTLMSFAENDLLSTILEETSIDLWTKGSSISMPGLDDLDSICSMESLDLDQQDSIHSQQESSSNEDIADFLNDSLGHMEISDHAEEDTQLQEPAAYSRLSGSQTSRATTSTASLSRTSLSLSSFAASPSSERRKTSTSSQVTDDLTEQRTRSLVGIDIQFFRSIEYGSISPMTEKEEGPSKCPDEQDSSSLEVQGESKSNKSKKKKKKNKKSKKDRKEKCDKKTDKKSKKNVGEKLKSKKTKNKKDKSKRKKLGVIKDSKQSKKRSKELDSSNVTKTRREILREKIRTRIESNDKKLRAIR